MRLSRRRSLLVACGTPATAVATPPPAAKVTILSTMLADEGIGEWGFSALVEEDGEAIVFDTGHHPTAAVGAVGGTFELGKGIDPGDIAR
jgi:hypothetical protein